MAERIVGSVIWLGISAVRIWLFILLFLCYQTINFYYMCLGLSGGQHAIKLLTRLQESGLAILSTEPGQSHVMLVGVVQPSNDPANTTGVSSVHPYCHTASQIQHQVHLQPAAMQTIIHMQGHAMDSATMLQELAQSIVVQSIVAQSIVLCWVCALQC